MPGLSSGADQVLHVSSGVEVAPERVESSRFPSARHVSLPNRAVRPASRAFEVHVASGPPTELTRWNAAPSAAANQLPLPPPGATKIAPICRESTLATTECACVSSTAMTLPSFDVPT